jgi:hypothetical protein
MERGGVGGLHAGEDTAEVRYPWSAQLSSPLLSLHHNLSLDLVTRYLFILPICLLPSSHVAILPYLWISLRLNKIGPIGAEKIAEALKINNTVTTIE